MRVRYRLGKWTTRSCEELADISHSAITSDRIFAALPITRSVSELDDELAIGKLDILVRTSNVKRLSDFMMWQVSIYRYEDLHLMFGLIGIRGHSTTFCQDILARVWFDRYIAYTTWMAAEGMDETSWMAMSSVCMRL